MNHNVGAVESMRGSEAPEFIRGECSHGLFALPVLELRSQHLRHDLNHLIHPPTLGQYLRYLFSLEWTRRYTR